MHFDIKSLKKKCKSFINWSSLLKMWKIKSIELHVWLTLLFYIVKRSQSTLKSFTRSVYIFFPEVIGICNINRDTDESFEISIEFQCDIFKRVSVFL